MMKTISFDRFRSQIWRGWKSLRLLVTRCLRQPRLYVVLGWLSFSLALLQSPLRAVEPAAIAPSPPATAIQPLAADWQTPVSLEAAGLGTSQPSEARTAVETGRTLYAAGRFAEAAARWQQAADTYGASGDRLQQALSLSYLSLAYQQLNQWEEAQQAIAHSLERLELSPQAADPILWAQVRNTQASLQLYTGQAEQALANWEQAQHFYTQAGDEQGALGSQINQAQALRTLGFYRRARQRLETVTQQLADWPDSDITISAWRTLGGVLQTIGNLDGSQRALLESLAIAERLEATSDYSATLLSLGKTALSAGQIEDSLYYFQQAEQTATHPLESIQAQLNQLHLYVDYQDAIATTHWYPVEALAFKIYQQLTTISPSRASIYSAINLVANVLRVAPSQQSIPRQDLAELLATAVQSARQFQDVRAEAYALHQWGALYAENQQWEEALRLTQQSLQLANAIQAKDIDSQAAWQLGRILKQQGNPTEAIAAYTDAVSALQSLRGDLVAIDPEVQFSFRESVEPVYRELVSLLLDGTPSQPALIQARDLIEALQVAELDNFFREACLDVQAQQIDQIDPSAALIYPILLPDRLAVIVSVPGQPLTFHAIEQRRDQIEQTLTQLLSSLHPASNNLDRLQLSTQVYDWLIREAETSGELANIKTLVFVLDGLLRNIPMTALYDGEQYLIEKYAIALSPGLRLLPAQTFDQAHSRAIVGGISEARNGFTELPAVETEVHRIAQLVSSSTLLNQDFTSESLAKAVQNSSANIVHLATHGQFGSRQDETFLLTWEGRMDVNELSELLQNRENNPSQIIDLLVLSACDTAAGDDRATLGLAGLAVKSGARSTMATLWPVKDQAAALLMTQFYEQLQEPGVTKAEALRQAQVNVLRTTDYTHPFFWSAFVLVGNWR